MQVILTIIRFILGFIGVILAVFTTLVTIASFEGGFSGDEISLIVFGVIFTLLTLGTSITLGENANLKVENINSWRENVNLKKENANLKKQADRVAVIINAKNQASSEQKK
jgi:Na+/melibiose symporter-like transporter